MGIGPAKVLEVGCGVFAAVTPRERASVVPLAAAVSPSELWLSGQELLLVPEALLEQVCPPAQVVARGLCRISVLGPWNNPQLPASATSALAEVGVPFVLLVDKRGWHFFLPQEKKGRALAALRQARLERFVATA